MVVSACSIPFVATMVATYSANVSATFQLFNVDVPLDHYTFDGKTFPLRVFVNADFYKPGGPVLFYPGNEAPIDLFITSAGAVYDAAASANALVVFAEHRYYGSSWPHGSADASLAPENITKLAVEQALADYATAIIPWVRAQCTAGDADAPAIAVGGSYAGCLAGYLRVHYPHVFAGAWASSGPMAKHRIANTTAFNARVTAAYAPPNTPRDCTRQIRAALRLLYSSALPDIQPALHLCDPVGGKGDVDAVYGWLSNGIETMVQVGYPYPVSFYGPLPAWPFAAACAAIGTQVGLPVLYALASTFANSSGQAGPCFGGVTSAPRHARDTPPAAAGGEFRGVVASWGRGGRGGLRWGDATDVAWDYQTCTEEWQPMASDGVTDFFLPYVPDAGSIFRYCAERWATIPRPTWWEAQLGGCNITAASGLLMTYGSLDPWSTGGCDAPLGDGVRHLLLRQAAHHLDLRYPNPADPPDVVAARAVAGELIGEWAAAWRTRRTQP